jgi:hypothetical protein
MVTGTGMGATTVKAASIMIAELARGIVCSKSSGDLPNMLDVGGSVVTMTHELAKFLIVLGATKIDGVIFYRFPFDYQTISAWFLDRTLDTHFLQAFGALKDRHRDSHASFEFSFLAWLQIEQSYFGDHVSLSTFHSDIDCCFERPLSR